ncbi:MAG: glycosyl transferase [Verrucomicrobia bacterium]|nr:glycosyl transferase [Verrucomicrobiota bacterium]MBV8273770.1 glycosyl transferase [Verrucomicrobiota bacterium]
MRIAFVTFSASGHLNPTTALARQLQSRNHEVAIISLPDAEPYVRAAGLAFIPYCEEAFSASSGAKEIRHQISVIQGLDGVRLIIEALGQMMGPALSTLPAALATARAEAVVLDTNHYYVEVIPMSLGLPYVHISNALHLDCSGYTPLCFYDWPHETTPTALARNRKGVANFAGMLKQANATVRDYAERAGLKIDWDDPGSTLSPLASITQVPRAFEFESSHWPPQFHHTGPFHDGNGRQNVDFPWERLTGEPLIYASMGTVMNGRADVFRSIVAALTKHKDLQLVLSVGDRVDPDQIGAAPKNAIIVKQAPQLELLKRSSVCITHAGLNTTLESLAQGVPQIAIPVTHDQPGVAARIADKQTGVVTSLDKLTAEHLSTLLDDVLSDPAYRANARKLQQAIKTANGLSVAADLIEEALGVTDEDGD